MRGRTDSDEERLAGADMNEPSIRRWLVQQVLSRCRTNRP